MKISNQKQDKAKKEHMKIKETFQSGNESERKEKIMAVVDQYIKMSLK